MKKIFVLDEDGNLVEKTLEEINTETPAAKKDDDPIAELTGLVKDLVVGVKETQAQHAASVQEKQEEAEAKIAAYEKALKTGFPVPHIDDNMSVDEGIEAWAPYDLAMQGKTLIHGQKYKYKMPEETRVEVAKCLCLFIKAGYLQDPMAKNLYRQKYGAPTTKTDVGDSGNVFPVPDIVMDEVLHYARERSTVLQLASVWPMISEKESFPAETTKSSSAWGNTTSESDLVVGEVELTAQELSTYKAVKNATLADSRTDIVSWLVEALAEGSALEVDNEAFNGDGYASDGACSGILSTAGYSVVMASGSTAFSAITADHLSELISKLDGRLKEGARFFMNGSILHFIRILKDTNDNPVYIPNYSSPAGATIHGYPYSENVKMPSTSAANTAFLFFGNLKHFAVGRRLDTTSLQVDPYGLWTTNRTRFKLYQRWALQNALPNGFARLLTAAS